MSKPTDRREWRTASYSQNDANCVQVRNSLDQLRDAKHPTGPVLDANVPALVAAIKTSALTSPVRDHA